MSFFDHIYKKFVQGLSEQLFSSSERLFSTIPVNKRTTFVIRGLIELLYMAYETVDETYKAQIIQDVKILLEEMENKTNNSSDDESFMAPETKDKN